jgi:hypothetical protein
LEEEEEEVEEEERKLVTGKCVIKNGKRKRGGIKKR